MDGSVRFIGGRQLACREYTAFAHDSFRSMLDSGLAGRVVIGQIRSAIAPRGVRSHVGRDVCYFDGRCGLCRRTTRVLRRLDWFGQLSFVDLTSLDPKELPVELSVALSGMPMRTRTGQVMVGFPAVRRALLRTPLGAPIALPMYVPGLSLIAERVYRHIAANRGRDVSCESGVSTATPD